MTLLALLRSAYGNTSTARGSLPLAPAGGVKGRIRRMLQKDRDRSPLSSSVLAVVIVVGSCVSIPVVGCQTISPQRSAVAERTAWLEAEEGWLQRPMRAENGIAASGWRYLRAPDDQSSPDEPPEDGRITYDFDVDQAGRYRVWGRARAFDGRSNSFWIRVDDGDWIRWNDLVEDEGWVWQPVHDSDRDGSPVVDFDLEPGTHTLELAYREQETQLDRLVVTNSPLDPAESKDRDHPKLARARD